jgi:hypothetical protein
MSMIHEAYFVDWHQYTHHVLRDSWPDSDDDPTWQRLLPHIKRHLCGTIDSELPDWKSELLEIYSEGNEDAIRSEGSSHDIESIRNLNFLALLSCTIEEAADYYKFWDTLKHGLRSVLGEQTGDELVLGVYWECCKAWEFAPDLVTYQYGILLPDMVTRYQPVAEKVTEDAFVSALRRLNFTDSYPVFAAEISDDDVRATVGALRNLQENLQQAHDQSCAVLYLLN